MQTEKRGDAGTSVWGAPLGCCIREAAARGLCRQCMPRSIGLQVYRSWDVLGVEVYGGVCGWVALDDGTQQRGGAAAVEYGEADQDGSRNCQRTVIVRPIGSIRDEGHPRVSSTCVPTRSNYVFGLRLEQATTVTMEEG